MKKFMARAALPLAFSLVLVCVSCGGGWSSGSVSTPSSATPGARSGTYMVCYTTSAAHGITLSAPFRIPAADQVTLLEEPWAKDFRTYVGQSGDEGAISVTCAQVDPKNPDAVLKDKIDAWQKGGIKVGRTNWKYAGG